MPVNFKLRALTRERARERNERRKRAPAVMHFKQRMRQGED